MREEDGVVAEVGGVVGVGFDGLFVEFLGAVVVVANVCEEDGVETEEVGIGGICRRDFL